MSHFRTRLLLASLGLLLLLGWASPLGADVSPSSITYLQSQPQNPWITMALVASGVPHPPTDHLQSVSGTTANDYAKTILAVAAVGENPATFGNIDYTVKLRSFAAGGQLGDPAFLNDDAWGILALSAAGVSTTSPEVTGAAAYLRAHQNSDGGFSYAVNGGSDTASTAAAIMALRESGLAADSSALQQAIAYLRSAQNSDGGFAYQRGDESDADSTAWVMWAIRKIGEDPIAWTKSSGNPVTFLESLQNADGSFAWKHSVSGANLFATQDAVLALAGVTMPVGYYRAPADADRGFAFRLEGKERTLCDKRLEGITAYDLLSAGSTACGYTFSGQTYEGMGFMLTQVNDEKAEGTAAWMYLVNNVPGEVGLQAYQLQRGDEILVYYDPNYLSPAYLDYDRPLRIALASASVASGQTVRATVAAFRDGQWVAVSGATVSGGPSSAVSDDDGKVSLSFPTGVYELVAAKSDYIRSQSQTLTVGNGVSDRVGLQVEVVGNANPTNPGGGTVAGSSIAFSASPDQLDFGRLQPGGMATSSVRMSNEGSVRLRVTAQVFGDPLFSGLTLDQLPYAQFRSSLDSFHSASATAGIVVPGDYLSRGVKTGELILWAEAR